MADNKMTSLLGKPGQSFGELAGAYLSGIAKHTQHLSLIHI